VESGFTREVKGRRCAESCVLLWLSPASKSSLMKPPDYTQILSECNCPDCISHALNWGRRYFRTKRSHTWKYVSALL
jgi:hypothetical protein